MSAPQSRAAPYATLLAKGEDRRQRILAVAERLLARNGWRNTSLAQIAKEAGVTPAGLLHHFESKEQLLNAVLDARDADDDAHADYRPATWSPRLAGSPNASTARPNWSAPSPCCWWRTSRPTLRCTTGCVKRYRDAVDIVTAIIERGQESGRYRTRRRRGQPRPSRSSPSSTEWRPYGCSIHRFRWPRCSRGTPSRWAASWRRRSST